MVQRKTRRKQRSDGRSKIKRLCLTAIPENLAQKTASIPSRKEYAHIAIKNKTPLQINRFDRALSPSGTTQVEFSIKLPPSCISNNYIIIAKLNQEDRYFLADITSPKKLAEGRNSTSLPIGMAVEVTAHKGDCVQFPCRPNGLAKSLEIPPTKPKKKAHQGPGLDELFFHCPFAGHTALSKSHFIATHINPACQANAYFFTAIKGQTALNLSPTKWQKARKESNHANSQHHRQV